MLGSAASAAGDVPTSQSAMDKQAAKKMIGGEEVPSVDTTASARSTITIRRDDVASGGLAATNIDSTAARIHQAPAGTNGSGVSDVGEGLASSLGGSNGYGFYASAKPGPPRTARCTSTSIAQPTPTERFAFSCIERPARSRSTGPHDPCSPHVVTTPMSRLNAARMRRP